VNKTAIETALEVDEDYIEDETSSDIVKELKFKSSKLTAIPMKVFEVFSQLEVLNAAGTELRNLLPRTFEKAENMLAIFLQNNRITKIGNEVFGDVRGLRVLDLSNNQIVKIHAKTFAELESLGDLNLSNNRISELDDETFANLRSLKSIGLESNKLTMIASNLFTKVHKSLATISMNFNQIVEVSPNVFDSLESLRFLFLSGNKCVDRSFKNHVIPNNVSIKMELSECFKKFRKVFPMSDGRFNITKALNQVQKSQEICDYEFYIFKKALEDMERQLEKLQEG
jgi:Leucine-rich repeat (LRR) protein